MKVWMVVLGVVALTLSVAPPVLAQKKCEEYGTANKPNLGRELQLRTASGVLVMREARASKCSVYSYGVADAKGKVLIPAKYAQAVPLTSSLGVVRQQDGRVSLYLYGKGERPAPFTKLANICHNGIYFCVGGGYTEKQNGLRDYWLYPMGQETPLRINDAERVERVNQTLLAHYKAPDGTALSRVLDNSGLPLSPAVRRIIYVRTVSASDERTFEAGAARNTQGDAPYDLLSAIIDVDDPNLPTRSLYLPLDQAGLPIVMPGGAVGVFPLHPQPRLAENTAFGWAVVFPGPDGVEFAAVHAPLKEALAAAATAPRIRGLVWHAMPQGNGFRDAKQFLTIRERDGWRVGLADRFRTPSDHIYQGHYPTSVSARDAYHAALNVKESKILAARESYQRQVAQEQAAWAAERARQTAERRAQKAVEWTAVSAAGTLCEKGTEIADYPVEAVNRFLRECEITTQTVFVRTDADPQALADGRLRYVSYHNAQVEEARIRIEQQFGLRQSVNAPGSGGGDPWAAGLAAAEAAAQSSMNSFMAQQASVYRGNLNAWNSGAQNWCCGASRP